MDIVGENDQERHGSHNDHIGERKNMQDEHLHCSDANKLSMFTERLKHLDSSALVSCTSMFACTFHSWLSCHRNAEKKSARICCENAYASGIPVRTGSLQLLLNSPGDFSGLANTHGACAWNYRNRGSLYGKARSISRTGAQFCPWASIETCPPVEPYIPKVEHQHEGSHSTAASLQVIATIHDRPISTRMCRSARATCEAAMPYMRG